MHTIAYHQSGRSKIAHQRLFIAYFIIYRSPFEMRINMPCIFTTFIVLRRQDNIAFFEERSVYDTPTLTYFKLHIYTNSVLHLNINFNF